MLDVHFSDVICEGLQNYLALMVHKTPVFEVNRLHFSYGRQKVLDNISLTIEAGNFYAIVGPNGCGKTTLLDIMAGSKTPGSGSIRYLGRDIKEYGKRKLAREIALVPQDFYIHFPFTVGEVVLMGRHPYIPRFGGPSREDIDIAEAIIEKTGLCRLKDKYITELSGGEKQRVVFARALVQDTPVLILDEATSNMDIQYTLNFLKAVSEEVSQAGRTVISALHDLNLAANYSNKMVFMKSGRIVSEGNTPEVLTEEGIKAVFNVESRVYFDRYSNSCQVSFKGIRPR